MSTLGKRTTNKEEILPQVKVVPLWRNRDYLLLWTGQTISNVGTSISALAFPLLVLLLTHSAAQAGIVGALGPMVWWGALHSREYVALSGGCYFLYCVSLYAAAHSHAFSKRAPASTAQTSCGDS